MIRVRGWHGLAAGAIAVAWVALAACVARGRVTPTLPLDTTGFRPNVVLVMMDDLGYGDVGSYGARDVQTPNIDRLASEGVRLTDFYANAPTCTPTRAALISGRYQQRVGLEAPLGYGKRARKRGLRPSPHSLPALLKTRGYATSLIGKWHLGFRPALGPNVHGFDEFWGFLSGGIDFYSHSWRDGTADLYHNRLPVRHDGYLTDELTRRAVAFIEQHAQDPFFVEVAYNAVHWPFQPPGLPEGQRKREHWVEDGTREDYVKMLASADDGIGAILSALDRHDIAKHTLVIFTSDNGGEWLSRNAPLFHRKFTLWEGGIRVPALLRWPGTLPVGVTSRQVGMTMDLTATILDAAGVRLPASYHPEGISLLPILAGKSELIERTLFWRVAGGDFNQKAVRKGPWKYMRDGSHNFLFNLDEDVGERNDLASANTKLLKDLSSAHAAWEKDVESERDRTK